MDFEKIENMDFEKNEAQELLQGLQKGLQNIADLMNEQNEMMRLLLKAKGILKR